jgi:hypothetical protein
MQLRKFLGDGAPPQERNDDWRVNTSRWAQTDRTSPGHNRILCEHTCRDGSAPDRHAPSGHGDGDRQRGRVARCVQPGVRHPDSWEGRARDPAWATLGLWGCDRPADRRPRGRRRTADPAPERLVRRPCRRARRALRRARAARTGSPVRDQAGKRHQDQPGRLLRPAGRERPRGPGLHERASASKQQRPRWWLSSSRAWPCW